MMCNKAVRISILTIMLLGTQLIVAAAQPSVKKHLRVETRCPDDTLEYTIDKHILSEVANSRIYTLVQDGSEVVLLRIIAVPVREKGDKKPLGVGLAILVTTKNEAGYWDVTSFSNKFVPMDDLEKKVRGAVRGSL